MTQIHALKIYLNKRLDRKHERMHTETNRFTLCIVCMCFFLLYASTYGKHFHRFQFKISEQMKWNMFWMCDKWVMHKNGAHTMCKIVISLLWRCDKCLYSFWRRTILSYMNKFHSSTSCAVLIAIKIYEIRMHTEVNARKIKWHFSL